jgi:hypothetical protein
VQGGIRQVGESKSYMASESRLKSRMSCRLIERPTKYGRVLHKLNQAFGIWTLRIVRNMIEEILVEQKTRLGVATRRSGL